VAPGRFENLFYHIGLGGVVSAVGAVLSYIAFQSQFWAEVKCDSGQVATMIYNGAANISEITNIKEVSFSPDTQVRTCSADVTAKGRKQKLIFAIDTSRKGQPTPLNFVQHSEGPKLYKFTLSYRLFD
jgi:hypothetical protein